MKYYTLAVKWTKDAPWTPEFGDSNKAVVMDEACDGGYDDDAACWQVIPSQRSRKSVEGAIAAMNGES